MKEYMEAAVAEAVAGVEKGDGGPFGAVIVQNGKIIVQAHNEVLVTQDPTAHAEITAIRRATALLGRFDLSDCVIYSSCEPCPMCLGAIYWAKIKRLSFAATRYDAADSGFDEQFIYDAIQEKVVDKRMEVERMEDVDATRPFTLWQSKVDKVAY